MRLSVLLRGSHFLEADRFGMAMDGRNNVKSLVEKLINPIREMSPEAKIYLATYDSPALEEIQAQLGPCETILLKAEGSSQAETYKEGIKHVFGKDDFDALVVSRFDLQFRKSFDTWSVKPDDKTIFFPWREFRDYWRDHRRVGDAVHIIGRHALASFHDALIMNQLARRTHLHMMYYYLRTMRSELKFIEDGYWCSNTLFANPECDNPLYRIFNRPRLEHMASTTGMFLEEIRAE
jgi:hypothetical protein